MSSNSQDGTNRVTVAISDRKKQRLNEIAFGLSEPGERVSASEVVREAITNYIEQYDRDPDECSPRERGALRDRAATEEGTA